VDKDTRNILRNTVVDCRRLLEKALGDILQGQFGIHGSGQVEPEVQMSHLSAEECQYRAEILAHLEHIKAGGFKAPDAVAQLVREVAFTHLNRLAAFKLMEERGLIKEAVKRGHKSRGFIFYLADHQAEEDLYNGGNADIAYRNFLLWLAETHATEVNVLFSPQDPANKLFPPQKALDPVLGLLNDEKLKDIWGEDETIGWIYQYFTPKELRDRARQESSAPRNSYELSFRNQFYTPRYVVEFLVDNTLGRIWYEMRQGKTELAEKCHYLVRRYDEVFLAERDKAERNLPSQTQADAAFFFGEAVQEIPPFETGKEKHWLEQTAANTFTFQSETNAAAMRLHSFAHLNRPFNWKEDPRQEEWLALLAELNQGDPQQPIEGKTQNLWDCALMLVRADRFTEGLFSSNLVAIARIANELRHRVLQARQTDLPQADLLKLPVFIPFRKAKDPRDIKIIDPACGSGHFLLYCFDLLEVIYRETYEDDELGRSLRVIYPTPEDFRKAVPGLILAHNLHGIDIDLRACQISALALWLHAQRTFKNLGLKPENRPKIQRGNIVCAEPMPGERELLDEFVTGLQPQALGEMVKDIFDCMQLASEAGSLLKVEQEVGRAIDRARIRWKTGSNVMQANMFGEDKPVLPEQLNMFSAATLPPEDFWRQSEELTIKAVQTYATHATNVQGLSRRLFADDAERGFAFIDICRKSYDVVLMNPPFGESSKPSKPYIEKNYTRSKNDILAAFVERWAGKLVKGGILGAITSRTCFFLSSFQKWREEIILKQLRPTVFADLGYGVLDTAMVETAAYCLEAL